MNFKHRLMSAIPNLLMYYHLLVASIISSQYIHVQIIKTKHFFSFSPGDYLGVQQDCVSFSEADLKQME